MKTSQFHFTSFSSFLFFAVSALFLLMLSGILGLSALLLFFSENQVEVQPISYFVAFGFLATLLGVASVISIAKFLNNPFVESIVTTSYTGVKLLAGLVVIGLVLGLGYITQDNQSINWLTLPLLTVPAAALPVWLILRLGIKELPLGSRWRVWGTLGLSMSFTPLLLFLLEVVAIVFIFLFVMIYVLANPQISMELQRLATQFTYIDPQSEEAIDLIMPFLAKPGVIVTALSLFSFIIPMMEEAFKPLVVWLLAGKLTSRAQGFALGALCGAGFALAETLNVSGQADGWAEILIARIGTSAMHITTSALIGSAIVSAFQENRYLHLLGTYLLSVLLHGAWNAAALTNGFATILSYGQPDRVQLLLTASTIGLIVLSLGFITILVTSNRLHQKANVSNMPEVLSDTQDNKSI